jgi:hypothetical protein
MAAEALQQHKAAAAAAKARAMAEVSVTVSAFTRIQPLQCSWLENPSMASQHSNPSFSKQSSQ